MLIINLETTSLDPDKGSIVEIAGVLYRSKYNIEPVINYLIKPKYPVTGLEWIFHKNRYITPAVLEKSMSFDDIRESLQYLFSIETVTSWNSDFDFRWLESYGMTIPNKGKDLKINSKHLQDYVKYREYPSALWECILAAMTI